MTAGPFDRRSCSTRAARPRLRRARRRVRHAAVRLRRGCAPARTASAYVAAFGAEHVAYAGKAFLCTAMVRLVAEEGLHLDVATGGELHVALRAGFPPERIVFHGNNKSADELARRARGRRRPHRGRLARRARPARGARGGGRRSPAVLVRVTPGVEAHTHEFIETGTEASKFGFTVSRRRRRDSPRTRVATSRPPRARRPALPHRLADLRARLVRRAIRIVDRLRRRARAPRGSRSTELNFGGGLGARYLAEDPIARRRRVRARCCATRVADARADVGLVAEPRLMVEPGRSIVAAGGAHALPGRHRSRRSPASAPTSPSTAG